MKSTTTVLWLMFLLAFLDSCYSRKCYICNSKNDDGCDKIIDDKYLIECPENHRCVSMLLNVNGTDVITRVCDTKNTTYSFDTCRSDGCNRDGTNATSFNAGSNIKCYNCVSKPHNRNPKCEKIADEEYLKDCKSYEECATATWLNPDKSIQQVERGCYSIGLKLISQSYCDDDKCNGKTQIATLKN